MNTFETTIQTAKHYLTCPNPDRIKAIQLYEEAVKLTDDRDKKSIISNKINKLKQLNK